MYNKSNFKLVWLSLILFCIYFKGFADEQNKTALKSVIPIQDTLKQSLFHLKGIVYDELNEPLKGVTIRLLGSGKKNTVQTDIKGAFEIGVSPTDSLKFTFLGYEDIVIPVANKTFINTIMYSKSGSLNEVAVIGYGRQKKESVVGAQATIKPEELKLPVRDLTTAIAGRLAGVIATQRSGAPGSDGANLFIRGVATFASSPQSPLLVVDGVPDRSINNIDPEDVESFTILKDATATAVYGARGANGVIIVNTKKGKQGKPMVNFEINNAISNFTALPKFLDAPNFMTLYNEGLVARGRTAQYSEEDIQKHASGEDPDLYPNVNWFDQVFRKFGTNSRANVNIRGGSEVASYYISAGYYTESGMFKKSTMLANDNHQSTINYNRYNFNSNVDVNLTKTTKVSLGVNGFLSNLQQPSVGANGIFTYALSTSPHVVPPIYSNGQWPKYPGTSANPYYYLVAQGFSNSYNNTIRSNIAINQELDFITPGLSFNTMYAFDVNTGSSLTRSRTLQTYIAEGRDDQGNLITRIVDPGSDVLGFSSNRSTNRRIYTQTSLNYLRAFGDHNVSGLFLFNQQDYVNGDADNLIASIPFRQRSIVGRVNYGYKDRYFVESNFGYTGSENFAPGKRYGFFPSVGGGWIVSKENFFKPVSNVISYLKLRYTYGLTGNSNTGDRFLFLSTIGSGGGYTFGVPGQTRGYTGYNETLVGNNQVAWETGFRHNLGIEFNFLKDDLKFIVELFKERRTGILLRDYTIPYISGFTTSSIPYRNVGITENKGIDLTMNYNKTFRDGFITFRGTFNTNKNINVYDGLPPWQYPWLNRTGQSIGQRFGFVALGLFKDQAEIDNSPLQTGNVRPGDIKYQDLNGDGIINSFDQKAIGYGALPRILYGINIGGGYKGFDLVLFFQGAGKVDFNYAGGFGTTPFSQGAVYGNVYNTILDRWTEQNPNPNAFYPRLSTNQDVTTNYYTSTWWIRRADYIRLKSAELGYAFKFKFLEKYRLKSCRLYINGTNLLTFSKWKFWDPELGDGNGAAYPNISTYNIGLRVNFN